MNDDELSMVSPELYQECIDYCAAQFEFIQIYDGDNWELTWIDLLAGVAALTSATLSASEGTIVRALSRATGIGRTLVRVGFGAVSAVAGYLVIYDTWMTYYAVKANVDEAKMKKDYRSWTATLEVRDVTYQGAGDVVYGTFSTGVFDKGALGQVGTGSSKSWCKTSGFWIAPCGLKNIVNIYAKDDAERWLKIEHTQDVAEVGAHNCFYPDEIFRIEMYMTKGGS